MPKVEEQIWMMRADLRQVLDNVSAARVYLKDIEGELWLAVNGYSTDREGLSCGASSHP